MHSFLYYQLLIGIIDIIILIIIGLFIIINIGLFLFGMFKLIERK